ncbi:MAG: hypothetical protein M0R76_02420 [Proteobacteria bacterium]|jgi:anti-sigma factor RsiW|nr:hypothetical protein [Pseudomonadota bacterium]NLN62861.1 hypothetical protein [Myxococcales bacterium]
MNESKEKLISRYYDGELSPSQRRRVERMLQAEPPSAAQLASLKSIGSLMQLMAEDGVAEASFEGVDSAVMDMVRQEKMRPSRRERWSVGLSEFFRHRKRMWIPAVSVAGMAAAAWLIMVPMTHRVLETHSPQSTENTWQAASAPVAAVSEIAISNASQHHATTYRIAAANGASIGVIWIDE